VSDTPIHIIIPVWGDAYTRCLLDVGLPAIMAPGNLPALGRQGHLCHIITTSADRRTIEAAPVFGPLSAHIDIRFDEIDDDPAVSGDRHAWQSYCNRVGIKVADQRGAAMVFLNPDVVVADGGLKALATRLAQGKRAIQVLGVRLVKEAVVPLLVDGYRSDDATRLTISPRELIALAMPNLHPLTLTHSYERPDLDIAPSLLFWAAASEGLVARCFHLHPMLVHPRVRNAPFSTTIDDDYLRAACPDSADEYVVVDSDEFCACELSGLDRPGTGQPRPASVDAYVAGWASAVARPQHFENVARRIVLHAGRVDEAVWRRACADSDEAINRILNRVLDLKLGVDASGPDDE
jgi:hypothetical protein